MGRWGLRLAYPIKVDSGSVPNIANTSMTVIIVIFELRLRRIDFLDRIATDPATMVEEIIVYSHTATLDVAIATNEPIASNARAPTTMQIRNAIQFVPFSCFIYFTP